ncbi:MAG: hypothetical protein SGI91_12250 [Alphaproteobacteria bacterium]|nr:hypothetical protein [Alphaproteobacteria bacterium]
MQLLPGRRIFAWALTVVIAPPVFIVLLILTALTVAAAKDWTHFISWFSPQDVVRDLPQLGAVVVIGILVAFLPTVVLGVPASIALHRMNIRSVIIFAAVGLILGTIGGAFIVATVMVAEPLALETPEDAVFSLAAYGATAAVIYTLIERRTAKMT